MKEKNKLGFKKKFMRLVIVLAVLAGMTTTVAAINPYGITDKIKDGISDAKEVAEGVAYVNDHKEAVVSIYDEYKAGNISQQELVEKVSNEIDVDYVYGLINEHCPAELKEKIDNYLTSLENGGVDVYSYLPDGVDVSDGKIFDYER